MINGESPAHQYVAKEITFTVFFHEQKVTALPTASIRAVNVKVGLEKVRNKWRVKYLDDSDLRVWLSSPADKSLGGIMSHVVLAAMMEMTKHDIDPLEVIGWSKLLRSINPQQIQDAYAQWFDEQKNAKFVLR